MKTIIISETGAPDVLRLREAELSAPQEGFNFVDIYQRRGEYPLPLRFRRTWKRVTKSQPSANGG